MSSVKTQLGMRQAIDENIKYLVFNISKADCEGVISFLSREKLQATIESRVIISTLLIGILNVLETILINAEESRLSLKEAKHYFNIFFTYLESEDIVEGQASLQKPKSKFWVLGKMPGVYNKSAAQALVQHGIYPSIADALIVVTSEEKTELQNKKEKLKNRVKSSYWTQAKLVTP